jgi:serine/threonine protein kinase/anti-anti-sigma regulatory factor
MQASISFKHLQVGQPVKISDVSINTFENAHPGKAYSFRFEDGDSVFVHSSDSEYKQLNESIMQPYIDFFKNADALIFDAQYTLEDVWRHKVDWGHSSAMIGVDLARSAGVKKLILFHHDPTCSDDQLISIKEAAEAYQNQQPPSSGCEIIVGYEGLVMDLTPPGTVKLRSTLPGQPAVLMPTTIFDERGIDQLGRQLADLPQNEAAAQTIIDMSQVERLTTASLKSLVTLEQARRGEAVVLAAPSRAVRQLIGLGGFSDYFVIYPSVEAALIAEKDRQSLNLPGQLLNNRYQIEMRLGASLLGTTLKAIDTQTGAPVALKILNPSFSREAIERFMRQAKQVMAMDFHAIAQVVQWGSDGDIYFVAEELVEGQTLHDALSSDGKPLALDEKLDIALNLNLALEHAHGRGVIHGNLKPRNIYLTDAGIKISGFGQGRLVEGRNLLDAPRLQLDSKTLSPEQILGQPLDGRVDLYALGVILYQLFTGSVPFSGTDQAVMQAHLHKTPHSPRQINPEISLTLEHLILKLLTKNPNDRYSSARQVRRVTSSAADSALPNGSAKLIGRSRQLALIKDHWKLAVAGQGQVVLLNGEPGIGKTRLAKQAAALCNPPVLLTARCTELNGSPSYHPFAELLQTYLATAPPEFFDSEIQRLLANLIRLVPQIRQILPSLGEPPPLNPKLEQLRLMTSLTQFIRLATQNRPWFIVLENLQWADQNSLELLRYLCYHLPSIKLLIVGTYRNTEVAADHPLQRTIDALNGDPNHHNIVLNRLNQPDVAKLLANVWKQPVPDNFSQMIFQHTGGNPFYVEEVIRDLAANKIVAHNDDGWHFPVVDSLRLPQSVRNAVGRRIERLNPNTQNLLRQAAVLGHSFRFDDIQALSGLPKWDAMEHLNLALEQQLISEESGKDAFVFNHTEIQNVLYTDLPDMRRRMLHKQAGELLEQQTVAGTDQPVEALARHFAAAGEAERALYYSYQAAENARLAYANKTALIWYQRCLDILDQRDLTDEQNALGPAIRRSMGGLLSLTQTSGLASKVSKEEKPCLIN